MYIYILIIYICIYIYMYTACPLSRVSWAVSLLYRVSCVSSILCRVYTGPLSLSPSSRWRVEWGADYRDLCPLIINGNVCRWGRERLPLESEYTMDHDMKVFPSDRGEGDNVLPEAETCFFIIKLPRLSPV